MPVDQKNYQAEGYEYPYTVPRWWDGGPVAVIASGPSLTLADVNYVRYRCPSIVVNDNYRLAPWADILYASDSQWWDYYKGVPGFQGLKITRDVNDGKEAAKRWGLKSIRLDIQKKGISKDPSVIHSGASSGYQAINLAYLFGGRKILLLGFDMQGNSHWFGPHPGKLNRRHPYDTWYKRYSTIIQDDFEIVNCSRQTALKCFRVSTIEQEL